MPPINLFSPESLRICDLQRTLEWMIAPGINNTDLTAETIGGFGESPRLGQLGTGYFRVIREWPQERKDEPKSPPLSLLKVLDLADSIGAEGRNKRNVLHRSNASARLQTIR